MTRSTVTYCGVKLECEFEFYPAEPSTWTEPGNPEFAVLTSCKVGGVEIYDLLSDRQVEDIEILLVEGNGEQEETNAGEYADLRRNERLTEQQFP